MRPENASTPQHARRPTLRRAQGSFLCLAICCAGLAACGKTEEHGEEAFSADRSATVWSSLAQVRHPVATLGYGERIEILEKRNDQLRVRTGTASIGWMEERAVMDSALWHRARALADRAAAMPIQGRASTDKLTNAHIDAGRKSPRVFQFRGGSPLEVLARDSAELAPAPDEGAGTKEHDAGVASPEVRREDWVLVRSTTESGMNIAGWVLRRFVKYEIPPELVDYSNQYRFVAWFELSRVPAGVPGEESAEPGPGSTAQKPQFLVAGVQGPEGQPCDFTLLRVYTWGAARHSYETAYVESNLCGHLPIRVQPAAAPGGNATFAFANDGKAGAEQREYAMHQTSVRRTDHRPAPRGGRAR